MGKNLLSNIEELDSDVTFERIKHRSTGKNVKKRIKVDHRKNVIDWDKVNWEDSDEE